MKNLTKKIIGSLFILFMINSTQAQNELDIIGNWIRPTYATVTFLLTQEEIDDLRMMVEWGWYLLRSSWI